MNLAATFHAAQTKPLVPHIAHATLVALFLFAISCVACGSNADVSLSGELAPSAPRASANAGQELVFLAHLGGKTAGLQYRRYHELAALLKTRLGRDVRLIVVRDHARIGELLSRGDCDFAALNMSANRTPITESSTAIAMAAPAAPKRSLILARRASLLARFDDLRGKSIAVAAPGLSDASAYVSWRLKQIHRPALQFFGAVRAVADHGAALRLLEQGRVDAACVSSEFLGEIPETLKIIDRSNPLPGDLILAGPWAPAPIVAEVRAILSSMGEDEPGRRCLAALHYSRFITDDCSATSEWRYGRDVVDAAVDYPLGGPLP